MYESPQVMVRDPFKAHVHTMYGVCTWTVWEVSSLRISLTEGKVCHSFGIVAPVTEVRYRRDNDWTLDLEIMLRGAKYPI